MAEFWPRDRWPTPPSQIPHPRWLQRVLCRWIGHDWQPHYGSGQGIPGWPQHEYCTRCWRFRDKLPTPSSS